jgi:hypothetical protein
MVNSTGLSVTRGMLADHFERMNNAGPGAPLASHPKRSD